MIAPIVLGAAAIWLSNPAIFVLAAIGCVLGWTSWRERHNALPLISLMGAMWLLAFGAFYIVRLSQAAN